MKKLTPEDIYYMQDKVVEWNKTFSNLVSDGSLIKTYMNLVKEEWGGEGEYYQSFLADDLVGRADGIADLIFTGFMLGSLSGTDYKANDEDWIIVVCKDKTYTLQNEVASLQKRFAQGDITANAISAHLIPLLSVESKYMDVRGVFDRVLASNLTKAIHISENVDIDAEIARIESEGRYAEVFAETNGDYIVLRAHRDLKEGTYFGKGKIVKASTFLSPEDLGGLEEFIYETDIL